MQIWNEGHLRGGMVMMLESVIFGLAEWCACYDAELRDVRRETSIEAVDYNSTHGIMVHKRRRRRPSRTYPPASAHSTLNSESLDKNNFGRFGS